MFGQEDKRILARLCLWGVPILMIWSWSIWNVLGLGIGDRPLPEARAAGLADVLKRVLTHGRTQNLRILFEGKEVGFCSFIGRPVRPPRGEIAYTLRCIAELETEAIEGGRFHMMMDTELNRRTEVRRFRLVAWSGTLNLQAEAALPAEEIVWKLRGKRFQMEQKTPLGSLDGLALAGPLGLPGLGTAAWTDRRSFDGLGESPYNTQVRLVRAGKDDPGVCFVVETRFGSDEEVSTWIRSDGRILRLDSSFGFEMIPMNE